MPENGGYLLVCFGVFFMILSTPQVAGVLPLYARSFLSVMNRIILKIGVNYSIDDNVIIVSLGWPLMLVGVILLLVGILSVCGVV